MYPNNQGWGQPQQGFGSPPGWPAQATGANQGWGQVPQPPAPQQAAPTPPSADDFLTGGHRAAKFDTFGQVVGGEIVEAPRVEQQTDPKTRVPQHYPSGDPKWVLLVSIQAQPADGDDDGVRSLYVKADMKRAVQKAIAQAGAPRLEIGGVLQVRYVRDEPNSSGSGLPKKIYEARYAPPAGSVQPAPATAPDQAVMAQLPAAQQQQLQSQFDSAPPF